MGDVVPKFWESRFKITWIIILYMDKINDGTRKETVCIYQLGRIYRLQ